MDLLLNRKKKIQISKQKEEIALQNINLLKMRTRAAVLEAYNAHLLSVDILKVRKEAEQFSFQTRALVTELFEQNKAEYEEVSRAADSYAQAREGVLQAEASIRETQIALEALIGVPYEEAERLGAQYKRD
jgi:outer membrane protein TolC